ncbi:hypothetical protein ACWGDE_08550 [Streptomyces sp. NPDC054956]
MADNERLASLTPVQRHQAAALALWRWRTPVLAFELDEEWGVDPSILESLFRLAAAPPGERSSGAYRQGIAELSAAPLFASEVDPDTIQLVQLETIDSLLTFGELLDGSGPDEVERMLERSSHLAGYLDDLIAGSFHSHPSEDAHHAYLAGLEAGASGGRGYLGAREFAVESACHEAIQRLPAHVGLPDSSAGRELLALCHELGEELAATLRWLQPDGLRAVKPRAGR